MDIFIFDFLQIFYLNMENFVIFIYSMLHKYKNFHFINKTCVNQDKCTE